VSHEAPTPPSTFFGAHVDAIREAAALGPVVDLACGRGRHALACAGAGLATLAIDRNRDFLAGLAARAREASLPLQPVRFDLEAGRALPLRERRCGAVLVFRYLHRPLAPAIERLLTAGGLLLYETFTTAQRAEGSGPRNPDFLLEPGELPTLFPALEPISYDEGTHDGAVTGRLLARARR
jgi:SAM-dependent methyltransferase